VSVDVLTPVERLRVALELAELARKMYEQRMRRIHPAETDAEIEVRVVSWMHTRPGAEHGDGVGRPVVWPRS
jgi:uncharacterized protein YaeQ